MISKEQVAALAATMKFDLNEEEQALYSEKLSNIISYLEIIQEVDTEQVTPTYHGLVEQVADLRPDEPKVSDKVEALLKQAPETKETLIQVPAILDDGEGGA